MPLSKNERVMFVHDNPSWSKTMRAAMQRRGYLVETANNAADALAKIQPNPPDILVCHMHIPESESVPSLDGGVELIKGLRTEPRFAKLPIILTMWGLGGGSISETYYEELSALEAAAYQRSVNEGWRVDMVLTNPYNPATLLQCIKRVIEVMQAD